MTESEMSVRWAAPATVPQRMREEWMCLRVRPEREACWGSEGLEGEEEVVVLEGREVRSMMERVMFVMVPDAVLEEEDDNDGAAEGGRMICAFV